MGNLNNWLTSTALLCGQWNAIHDTINTEQDLILIFRNNEKILFLIELEIVANNWMFFVVWLNWKPTGRRFYVRLYGGYTEHIL